VFLDLVVEHIGLLVVAVVVIYRELVVLV